MVFMKNNTPIAQNKPFDIFLGIMIFIKFTFISAIRRKKAFNNKDIASNRYISVAEFNLPPQTIVYGIIPVRIVR